MNPQPTLSHQIQPALVSSTSGLVICNVGKTYNKRPIIRNVSLSLQRGEVLGLLGPNGAGKTTCFYIITGLITADYGQVMLDGMDITPLPMYRRARMGIGYLPQEPSIFRGLSVADNITAILEIVEPNIADRKRVLEDLLNDFNIGHLRDTLGIALSGGERRRVEIARALATKPSFILLDEPFAGIDPITIDDIYNLILILKERGIGVLITDHNVRETLGIIDRAVIIHDGINLMEGTAEEIIENDDVQRLYLGKGFKI